MPVLIRTLAALAAVSVLGTVWFVIAFAGAGGLRGLLDGGALGMVTLVGWLVTVIVGPVAAWQLWGFRESGRRAAIVLFGNGLAYYLAGLFALRTAEAPVRPILMAVAMFALPLGVLLSPAVRAFIAEREASRQRPPAASGE